MWKVNSDNILATNARNIPCSMRNFLFIASVRNYICEFIKNPVKGEYKP